MIKCCICMCVCPADPDVSATLTLLILKQHSNQPIRFERHVSVLVKFRLPARQSCSYISVIHLPLNLEIMLWVGLGLGADIFQIYVVPRSTKYVDPGTCLTLAKSRSDDSIINCCRPIDVWNQSDLTDRSVTWMLKS